MVGSVVIVRVDEFHLGREVAAAFRFQFVDRDGTKMFGIPLGIRAVTTSAGAAHFGHEGGLRLKSVQVHVEGKCLLRLSRQIFVGKSFSSRDGVLGWVELGVDGVGHNADRERSLGHRRTGGSRFWDERSRGSLRKQGRAKKNAASGNNQKRTQSHASSHQPALEPNSEWLALHRATTQY